MLLNGPLTAGLARVASTRLSSSLTFGMRHWPAVDPSDNPHDPLASALAAASAADQLAGAKQPAFFSHTRPVDGSVTVPLALSTKRLTGSAAGTLVMRSDAPYAVKFAPATLRGGIAAK